MLYVSSRNKADAYTAVHTLQKDICSDGGRYIPVQIPSFSPERLQQWKEKGFAQCVAEILNLFFTARLDARDVEFAIGKRPLKIVTMSHKILVAEVWHNPAGTMRDSVKKLVQRILDSVETPEYPTSWARTCVWIAFLFGIYAELARSEQTELQGTFDIAVAASDLTQPVAAWYARMMGLPIRTIILGCDDGGALWDLLNHGTASDPRKLDPDVERFILKSLGQEEAKLFADACQSGNSYHISEEQCAVMKNGMFAAVISSDRTESVIGNVYRTNSCILEQSSALGFGGLQDYRAGAGETVPALILMENSPANRDDMVAKALGVSVSELQKMISQN